MKKLLLPLFMGFFAVSGTAQINNGGFENWTKINLFEHPLIHGLTMSSNYETFFDTGELNVYQTEANESNVLHIENIEGSDGVQPGFFIFGGRPSGNALFSGGVPVNDDQISGIAMDMHYELAGESEGFVLLQFKSGGEPVGEGTDGMGFYLFPISGSQDWANVEFNFDAPLGLTPDECVIAIASGDLMNSDSPFALGSVVEVDNIEFLGSTNTIPGADFENWGWVDPISVPDDCYVETDPFEAHYSKSIDEQEGVFALKLTSNLNQDAVEVGYVLMGDRSEEGMITPTIQIQDESMLSFHYKYSGENDKGYALATFYQQDGDNFIPVIEQQFILEPNTEYEMVEYNFQEELEANATTADFMTVEFKSSSPLGGNQPQDGSTLLVDGVSLGSTTGIAAAFRPSFINSIIAYPNPTKGRVVFRFTENSTGYYRVFNSTGVQVDIRSFDDNREIVYDLTGQPAGIYVFQFHTATKVRMVKVLKL